MDFISHHRNILSKILVSVLVIVALGMFMDFSKFTASMGEVRASAWLGALLFLFLQILALSYRWLKLINIYEDKITFRFAVKTNLASMLANYLFITSIGGMIVRVAMSVKRGVSLTRSIAATVLDRGFTLLALIALAAVFLPVLDDVLMDHIYQKTALFVLGLFIAGGLLFALMFEDARKKIIFSHRKVAICFRYLRSVFTDPKTFTHVALASIIAQAAHFAAIYCVMASMGVEFNWLHFMAVIPVITIIASLPVGYGGWGIREGAFVYGLGLINIPFETAFAASVQIGLLSMASALILGIPAMMRSDLKSIFRVNR